MRTHPEGRDDLGRAAFKKKPGRVQVDGCHLFRAVSLVGGVV